MGGFHVLVEVTARDIVSVLQRARVGTDTVADVKTRLSRLLSASTNELELRRSASAVNPFDICKSICNDVVDDVCNVRAPLREIAALERRCCALREHCAQELEKRRACELELEFARGKLARAEAAQEYLMGCYFKESRLLRQQVETQAQKFERQLRAQRGPASPSGGGSAVLQRQRSWAAATDGGSWRRRGSGIPTPGTTASPPPASLNDGPPLLQSATSPVMEVAAHPHSPAAEGHASCGVAGREDESREDAAAAGAPSPLEEQETAAAAGFVSGVTGCAVFDYVRYVHLIDASLEQWPERLRLKEAELEEARTQHATELTASAHRHRQEVLQLQRALESRDAYLRQVTGNAQALGPLVTAAVRRGCADARRELDDLRNAHTALQRELQRCLAVFSARLREVQDRVDLFTRFVEHCTEVVQEQVVRIFHGQRVNATRGRPLWHYFLLQPVADPDEGAKLFWQQSQGVRAILYRFKDIMFKLEDISRLRAPSVYDCHRPPAAENVGLAAEKCREFDDDDGDEEEEDIDGEEEDANSVVSGDDRSRSAATTTAATPPARRRISSQQQQQKQQHRPPPRPLPPPHHHRRLSSFGDVPTSPPEWMRPERGFARSRRGPHERFVAPRMPPSMAAAAATARDGTTKEYEPSPATPRPQTRAHRRRSDVLEMSRPRVSSSCVSEVAAPQRPAAAAAAAAVDEVKIAKMRLQRAQHVRAAVKHVMRRVALQARRNAFYARLPQATKNLIATLQHADDDIDAETHAVERNRVRAAHLLRNANALRTGAPPISFANFAAETGFAAAAASYAAGHVPSAKGHSGGRSLRRLRLPVAKEPRRRHCGSDSAITTTTTHHHQQQQKEEEEEEEEEEKARSAHSRSDTEDGRQHRAEESSSSIESDSAEGRECAWRGHEGAAATAVQEETESFLNEAPAGPALLSESAAAVVGIFVNQNGNELRVTASGDIYFVPQSATSGLVPRRVAQLPQGAVAALRGSVDGASMTLSPPPTLAPPQPRDLRHSVWRAAGPSNSSSGSNNGGRSPQRVTTAEGFARVAALPNIAHLLAADGPNGLAGENTDRDLLRIRSLSPAPPLYVPLPGSCPSREQLNRSRELLLCRAKDGITSPTTTTTTAAASSNKEWDGRDNAAQEGAAGVGHQGAAARALFTPPRLTASSGSVALPPL